MGTDINTLPEHLQKKIRAKMEETTSLIPKAKAVPHDSRMNKTETNYAGHLEKLKLSGQIIDWRHEPFNLRLADRTFYKPDFAVITNDGYIYIDETKGRWEDDALVKIKVAAELHPYFKFRAVFNERGAWKYRYFNTQKGGFVYVD